MAPGSRSILTSLGETEMDILNAVWRLGRVSVAEVRDSLERDLAHNTVQTIMRKLSRKGYLHAELVGKTHFYTPRKPEHEVKRGILRQMVASVFGGSRSELVRALADGVELSEQETATLRKLVEDLEASE
ncbi:MAG: BlaI/MecI/CopY family transcriptional regulator [Rhodothermales bacterium]|nr:BlaI/MecI/CopY family transcriptional regulator [Rhodothermales bacterium]MBO6779066.1 BlaI/MecI/CopY family transcriptional regulator [Rhodothermales bacterium]